MTNKEFLKIAEQRGFGKNAPKMYIRILGGWNNLLDKIKYCRSGYIARSTLITFDSVRVKHKQDIINYLSNRTYDGEVTEYMYFYELNLLIAHYKIAEKLN